MKYLIDTCVFSELVRSSPDSRVVDWFESVDERDLFLSTLTIGEIQKWISKHPMSQKRNKLALWLEKDLIMRFKDRIILLGQKECIAWGMISGEMEVRGNPLPVIDGLLCAIAFVHDLCIVTRNTADFSFPDVKTVSPWNKRHSNRNSRTNSDARE